MTGPSHTFNKWQNKDLNPMLFHSSDLFLFWLLHCLPFPYTTQGSPFGPFCWNPGGVESENRSSKTGWIYSFGNMEQLWKYGWINSGSGNLHYRSPNIRMWTEYRIWPLVQLNLWNNHMLLFILYLAVLEEKNNIHLRKTLVTANLLATLFPLAFLEGTERKSSCTN